MEISPMKTPNLPITTQSGETEGEAGAMDPGAAADFQEMLQTLMRGAPPDDPAEAGLIPPGTYAAADQAEEEHAAASPAMDAFLNGTAPAPVPVPVPATGMPAMATPANSVIAGEGASVTGESAAVAAPVSEAAAHPHLARITDDHIGAGDDRFAAKTDAAANPPPVPGLPTQQAEGATGNRDGGVTALALPMTGPVMRGADHSAVSPAPQSRLESAVGTTGWGNEFAQKVMWIAGDKQQSAELHLNPPELGPLSIRLAIDDDQASAVFLSAHSEVREAIQAALPRLREVLAENGIALGNASVTADSPREGSAFDRRQQPQSYASGNAAGVAADDPAVARPRGNGSGLVNLFA